LGVANSNEDVRHTPQRALDGLVAHSSMRVIAEMKSVNVPQTVSSHAAQCTVDHAVYVMCVDDPNPSRPDQVTQLNGRKVVTLTRPETGDLE